MRDKIHDFLNKSIKEFNPTLLVACSIVFLSLVALISYKVSSSYALFTDTVNGTKTITLHYAEDKTTLYTDGTLIINERASDRAKNIQKHGEVTNEYDAMKTEGTDAEKYVFSASSQRPWDGQASSITSVEIGQVIQPTSTAYWFSELNNMTTGYFTNLDTKNVTNMGNMFLGAGKGSSVTSFTLTGLDDWDTSKVTNMSGMFSSAGRNATTWTIGDLSNWDTSKVTNMSSMFSNAGYSASNWNVGDLSNWDTSKVTGISSMFQYAGRSATTWNIGSLSNWDTSNVSSMSSMFYEAGYSTTTFSVGDLSNWDTSKVTYMNGMFKNAGYSATTWSIGTISNWDTSQVKNMSSMFENAGYSATMFDLGDLSAKIVDETKRWDTSNVTDMQRMFMYTGYSSITWKIGDLSNWNTSKVTDMSSMFSNAGYNATTWASIGTLNVYTTYINSIFYNCSKAKAVLNIYSNPGLGSSGARYAFNGAATASDALITVNYSSATTNIDSIIATKSSNSNVVKGVQLD